MSNYYYYFDASYSHQKRHTKTRCHQLLHVPSGSSFMQNYFLCSDPTPVRNVYTGNILRCLKRNWSLQKVMKAVKTSLYLGLVVWSILSSLYVVHWSQTNNIKTQKFMESIRQQRQGTMESWDAKTYLTRKFTTNMSSRTHSYWKRVRLHFLIQSATMQQIFFVMAVSWLYKSYCLS